MDRLTNFDRTYGKVCSLLRDIEAEFGNAHPMYESLDEWRLELIESAPGGWLLADFDPPEEEGT